MRYGVCYKGSKNQIAEWIVDNLPSADTFVDLFCGGGAITHRALLSGKYKHFIMNDIDARLPKLFIDCANGKYTTDNHKEWISRDDFFRLNDTDAYIALVWSFGNNGKDYIYGKDIEQFKKALHYAVMFDDVSLLNQYILVNKSELKTIDERYKYYQLVLQNKKHNLIENVSRLISCERLQSLQSLQSYGLSYEQVTIPHGALIYCDIPYCSTNCGKYSGFNHSKFYEWASEQENIFISEYEMPDEFIEFANIEKTVLSSAIGNNSKAIEKIFTNKKTYDKLSNEMKERQIINTSKQMNLFDFGIY